MHKLTNKMHFQREMLSVNLLFISLIKLINFNLKFHHLEISQAKYWLKSFRDKIAKSSEYLMKLIISSSIQTTFSFLLIKIYHSNNYYFQLDPSYDKYLFIVA